MLDLHRNFIEQALPLLRAQERILGVGLGGSYLHGGMDAESDLDFVIVVNSPELTLSPDRLTIAESLGPLLQGFTGEHVGEPRLVICLYGPPLLHVDLKFVTPDQLQSRIEDPVILFDRSGQLPQVMLDYPSMYPRPDAQWIEDRFWIWIHYAAGKIRRGEYMTAYTTVGFLLERAVVPLAMDKHGHRAVGTRRLEASDIPELTRIQATCVAYDPLTIKWSLEELVEIYLEVRPAGIQQSPAQDDVIDFLRGT